nr:hypothetical protein [Amycolatopsis pithecellobii]
MSNELGFATRADKSHTRRIDVDDLTALVDDDPVGAEVDQKPVAVTEVGQRLLRFGVPGYVRRHAHQPGCVAGTESQRPEMRPSDAAIWFLEFPDQLQLILRGVCPGFLDQRFHRLVKASVDRVAGNSVEFQ